MKSSFRGIEGSNLKSLRKWKSLNSDVQIYEIISPFPIGAHKIVCNFLKMIENSFEGIENN